MGNINNWRSYGSPPWRTALLHGGPGAAGEMAAPARELSRKRGVLEPLQTAASLAGQVEELKEVLLTHGQTPLTLVGFSWGAWLGLILAARHPRLVGKLILVGCGPLREKDAAGIYQTRLNRLDKDEQASVAGVIARLNGPAPADENRNRDLQRLGELFFKADSCDPLPIVADPIDVRADIYLSVWPEAAELRRSGRLLNLAGRVLCPIVAIHGDWDPHPAEGVKKPLASLLEDFRFVLLRNCGHRPWLEKRARDEFFRILEQELA